MWWQTGLSVACWEGKADVTVAVLEVMVLRDCGCVLGSIVLLTCGRV